jgi:hypothetical protein
MKKIKNILGIAAGIVLAVGPYTFLHVCGAKMKMDSEMGGMDMGSMAGGPPCHGIPTASLITGIVLVLVSIISLITESKTDNNSSSGFEAVLDLVRIVLGVIAIGIPTFIIGVCKSAHMHCHMVTRPALIIIGVVVGLTGVISLAYRFLVNATDGEKTYDKVTSEA